MRFFQFLGNDVGIDLRGGYIDMPQEFLYRPEVGIVLQQVGGKGMSQGMRRYVLLNAGPVNVSF